MAETSHCDNYAKVYPTPIVLVEYKGFAVIAELSYLTDENRLNLVHALRSPSVRQDKSVFEKLLNLSKLFNLQPHSIITEGLCFNNVISSGVVGYTVNGRQDIFLKNLRNLLPLDHICGVDNSYCKVSDSTASKHLGAKGTCKDSMVFSSIESDIMASVSIPAGGKSKSVLSLTVNENHRFRPEFLSLYAGKELSSDSFTIYSSGDSEEAAKNNQKSTEASNFLRTGWIPMFANALDSLEFRPLESSSLTNVMHYCGINMRYLGSIAKCIKLPMLKHLVVIEMVARATKVLFREKMRERILYFTKIGATKVYEEEARRTIRMINGVLNVKNGVSPTSNVVCNLVMKKFNYSITPGDLSDINPQSLLNAIQYNWGLRIEGELSGTTGLIQKKVKITYLPKTKAPMAPYSAYTHCNDAVCSGSLVNHKKLSGSAIGDPVSSEFVRNYIAYFLHRYFAGINAKSKMKSSDATAEVLVTVSAYYNQLHLSKEAEVYALTAINNEPPNDLWKGLAYYQILVSKVNSIITNKRGVCATQNALIDEFVKSVRPQLSETYESSIFYMQNNLQDSHLGLVAVHDAIANACIVYGLYDEAITYLKKSWKISQNALGNNHIATGYYAAKIGRYYLRAMNYRDAIYWLEICQKVLFDTASYEMALTSSEVELCLAEAYLRSGDHDKALYYAEFSTNVRSTKLGNINPYTISSYILLIEVLMISLNKNIGQDFKQIVNRKKVLSLLGKVFLFIKLYGKNACSGDVCGWLDSIENISKKDLYKKGSAGENPYEALYIKLLSEAVGSGYIHKVEATENIESLICDNAVGKTRVPCQFSEIIMRKNPLSSALSNPILISGPLLDHKFAVLPEINIHTLYSVISKVFFMKLKDVKDGDAKCIINKISSRVREKGDIYARSAIPEVIKGIYVVGPELYFDGVIHRVDEKDPTVVSELEVCINIASSFDTIG